MKYILVFLILTSMIISPISASLSQEYYNEGMSSYNEKLYYTAKVLFEKSMKSALSEGNQKVANDASTMIVKCNALITKSENADSYYASGSSALDKGNYLLAYTNLAEAERLYKELGFGMKEKLAHDKKIEASTLNNAQNKQNDTDDKYSDYSGLVQVLRQALGGFSTIIAKIAEALKNQG